MVVSRKNVARGREGYDWITITVLKVNVGSRGMMSVKGKDLSASNLTLGPWSVGTIC